MFQSAPERGLRGIPSHMSNSQNERRFNPPRSAGSGESWRGTGEFAGGPVSIRPGARAPGNPRPFPSWQKTLRFNPPRSAGSGESCVRRRRNFRLMFQSAPERGLRGIRFRKGPRRRRRGFNPPRSAGSGESPAPTVASGVHRVSIRPGARAPGNHSPLEFYAPTYCFNPPRSAGSGESVELRYRSSSRSVSIRPGARAPGNRSKNASEAFKALFQSAPERGLRGIRVTWLRVSRVCLFQSAPERGLRGINPKSYGTSKR